MKKRIPIFSEVDEDFVLPCGSSPHDVEMKTVVLSVNGRDVPKAVASECKFAHEDGLKVSDFSIPSLASVGALDELKKHPIKPMSLDPLTRADVIMATDLESFLENLEPSPSADPAPVPAVDPAPTPAVDPAPAAE